MADNWWNTTPAGLTSHRDGEGFLVYDRPPAVPPALWGWSGRFLYYPGDTDEAIRGHYQAGLARNMGDVRGACFIYLDGAASGGTILGLCGDETGLTRRGAMRLDAAELMAAGFHL
jgi:hypothetical protein